MTPTTAGLLTLAATGTAATVLTRLLVQALREIDVEVVLDPYGRAPRRPAAARSAAGS